MPDLAVTDEELPPNDQKMLDDFIPDDPPLDDMSQKMVNFVDYLIIFSGNKSRAYKEAGYAVANDNVSCVQGHRLLKNRKVQRLLAWRLNQIRKANQIEVRQQRVILELNRLAYSSIGDFCRWTEDGNVTMKDMDDLTDDVIATIKKVKCTRTVRTDKDGNETESTALEIEQHDKKGPLEILSRASKLIDKGSASVPVTINMNFGAPQADPKAKVVSEQ